MAPPRTVNATQRFEFKASESFFLKLDYLATRYSNGTRAQFLRDCVELFYHNTSTLEASANTPEPAQGVLHG